MIVRLQSRAQAHFSKKTIFQKINPNKIDHLCASLQGGENCFQASRRGILVKPMVATPVCKRQKAAATQSEAGL
jgi:hypothetical protein